MSLCFDLIELRLGLKRGLDVRSAELCDTAHLGGLRGVPEASLALRMLCLHRVLTCDLPNFRMGNGPAWK